VHTLCAYSSRTHTPMYKTELVTDEVPLSRFISAKLLQFTYRLQRARLRWSRRYVWTNRFQFPAKVTVVVEYVHPLFLWEKPRIFPVDTTRPCLGGAASVHITGRVSSSSVSLGLPSLRNWSSLVARALAHWICNSAPFVPPARFFHAPGVSNTS
jgi:hypothetical protein